MNDLTRQSQFIEPGYIYITPVPTVLYAVVGTCVAVTVWDRVRRIGGMNHFLYPKTSDPDRSTAQYGNVSVSTLLRMMENAGSRLEHLEAQLFGGAALFFNSRNDVGAQNVAAARHILHKRKIRIVSEDIGGIRGRKIAFDNRSGHVIIHKVQRLRQGDWHFRQSAL